MVCPNCHSKKIIGVQNQHFCINCGQIVPEPVVAAAVAEPAPAATAVKATAEVVAGPPVKLQPNGLPEGVEILPLSGSPEALNSGTAKPAASAIPALIHGHSRFAAAADKATAVVRRRKPGRPKAGRLDIPQRSFVRPVELVAPEAAPKADMAGLTRKHTPKLAPVTIPPVPTVPAAKVPDSPLPPAASGPRRLSDLAPRRAATASAATSSKPSAPTTPGPAPASAISTAPAAAGKGHPAKRARHHRSHHRAGVPVLHYRPVLMFSLRARARPRLVALAAMAALSLGIASAYGAAQLLQGGGLPSLAQNLLHAGPRLLGEIIVLGVIYYVGRSLGLTAITYGVAREADQRPVTLSRQLGVAVNTFGRRLRLDVGCALAELLLLGAGTVLFLTGGRPWPVNPDIQISAIFLAYLVLLYLWISLAIARGLAGVNLAVTKSRPGQAMLVGWRLFSHRLELIGPRFGAIIMEMVLALPLLALMVALVISTPSAWHPAAIIGAGLLAWLAGALLGVGTAAWWAALYRALVMTDYPAAAVALLSSRQPEEARRLPLAGIIVLSTLAAAAGALLPWLSLV